VNDQTREAPFQISPALLAMVQQVPIYRHDDRVLHRGYFDGRRNRAESHEGCLLSASPDDETDEAWLEIAELGALPLWQFEKVSGFSLVDFHGVPQRRRARMLAAAADAGLVERVSLFKVRFWDSEADEDRFTYCETAKQAKEEAAFNEGTYSRCKGFSASDELAKFWNAGRSGNSVGHSAVFDALLAFLVENSLPSVDGIVWWDDFEPTELSAPRIGLFGRTLGKVTITKLLEA